MEGHCVVIWVLHVGVWQLFKLLLQLLQLQDTNIGREHQIVGDDGDGA